MPRYKPLYINDFTGGLNSRSIPSKVGDNQFIDILNMEFDPTGTYLQTRPGTAIDNDASVLGSAAPRVTSGFGLLRTGETDSQIIYTYGNTMWGNLSGSSVYQKLNDGFTIANNTLWYWTVFNDSAIGVNGDTTNTNPVIWDGTSGDGAALGGTPPNGRYITTWNSRVFMADADDPTKLYFSTLGDAEDWTTSGIAGSGSISFYKTGEEITGIAAHIERFFVFFRNSIWQIITANPNTDPTYWRVELLTKDGGCISQRSIQTYRNDLIFLSDDGVVSLNALMQWGDFDRALISRNIDIPINSSRNDYASGVLPDKAQYWIATGSGQYNDEIYVLDKDDTTGQIRWTKFIIRQKKNAFPAVDDGAFAVADMTLRYVGGIPGFRLFSGKLTSDATNAALWTLDYPIAPIQGHIDCWDVNGGVEYQKYFQTKAYSFGTSLIHKKLHTYGLAVKPAGPLNTSPELAIDMTYRFDTDDSLRKITTFDFGTVPTNFSKTAWRRASGFPGNRFRELDLKIENNNTLAPKSGFILKECMVEAAETNKRHITQA